MLINLMTLGLSSITVINRSRDNESITGGDICISVYYKRKIHNLQSTCGVHLGVSDFKGMDESEKIQKRLHGGWSENQFM